MNGEKERGALRGAAMAATVIAFLAYPAFDLLIGASCGTSPFNHTYNRTETALALAGCAGVLAFIFIMIVGAFKRPDKLEKVASLLAIAWTLVWLAYMFSAGDICWDSAVRSAAAFLFVPIALIALAILGRRWMASDAD